MRKTLALLVTCAATCAAALLGENEARAGEFEPWFATTRIGGYLDFWPAENLTASLFGAELQIRIARHVYLDMAFSGAVSQVDNYNGGDVVAAYGNPVIGAHYANDITPRFSFFVGGTLALPFLHDPAEDVAVAALLAAPIRGYYDLDRLAVSHMAVRAMGGFEWNFIDPLYLRAELRPVVYIPTRDTFFGAGVRNDPDFFLEHAAEFEGRLRNGLGFGARIQAVALATSNGDQAQVVFEPFLALTPKRRGFYMRIGFPLALDEPLGFGLDRNKLAAFRLQMGGQL